eukprot:SAG11_NODE_343_length_10455_cov_7.072036_5_plen_74_part_00
MLLALARPTMLEPGSTVSYAKHHADHRSDEAADHIQKQPEEAANHLHSVATDADVAGAAVAGVGAPAAAAASM